MVKIVIAGGSGQVGAILSRWFSRSGADIVVLSRRGEAPPGARAVGWDGRTLGPWAAELDGADIVVNLAGRSVDCRYTAANRRAIVDSRVDATRVLGEAIAAAPAPPRVWLQASTATIYAHRFDAPNDERTGRLGGHEPDAPDTWRFSIDVAQAWERAALDAPVPAATRLVLLRSAMVMSPDPGGVFDVLLRLVRFGLGGAAAGGGQYVSWIHHEDFARAVEWLIEHDEVEGPVNLAAPEPLPQRDFMRALRGAWGARVGLPATRWMLEAGAVVLRTETELVLKSRRVVPGRLLEHGFTFEQPSWPASARDLVAAWRAERAGLSPAGG
jgi:uncharacterized protein (TIGR01777 family)